MKKESRRRIGLVMTAVHPRCDLDKAPPIDTLLTMRWARGLGVVILLVLSGCGRDSDSEFQPGEGEPGAFVLAQVIKRGVVLGAAG